MTTPGTIDPGEQGVRNTAGTNEGVLIQVRDIHGDVTIKAPERKAALPRQLPVAIRKFVGRRDELAGLTAVLDEAASTGVVVVSAINGSAGVGKTALALYWAHQAENRFPDGQLYVNLAGFDPSSEPMDPAVAVRGFLDALDIPPSRIPASLDAQAALYRSLVADRRMLVLLDNCRDSAQVRPLLPGGSSCMVIITSRDRLESLAVHEGARRLMLGLLTVEEARTLLEARLGADRVSAESAQADELIRLCACLPLALGLVAARAEGHPDISLADLVAELRDEVHGGIPRIEEFDLGDDDTNLGAVFSWSYRALPPEAARLFRLIGLHPGPDISATAGAALCGLPPRTTRRLLQLLVNANLLEEPAAGRYHFHDLLRTYAMDRATAEEPEPERLAAITRVLDFYLQSAFAADRRLYPNREPITLIPSREKVEPRRFRDLGDAMKWFAAEYPCLLAALDLAAGNGLDGHGWQLPWCMITFMDRQAHWRDWVAVSRTAIAAATRLGAREGVARLKCNLGTAYAQRELDAEALAVVAEALAGFQEIGDRTGEAHAHHSLAWITARQQAKYTDALPHAERSVELHRLNDNDFGAAEALNTTGWLHGLMGDHQKALECCQAALAAFERLGQRHSMAFALDHIADAYRELGRFAEAVDHHRQAIATFHEINMAFEEAVVLNHLGDAALAAGDAAAARSAWQQGKTIFTQLERSEAATLEQKLEELDETGS
jgi:tetratricopeptide (TPR) repeat protein